jgi:hypothetical protein
MGDGGGMNWQIVGICVVAAVLACLLFVWLASDTGY